MNTLKKYSALFLDRDGVINTELSGDYVKTWAEFRFENGVFEALSYLQTQFNHLIIVTNQRGVGAGLMTYNDLTEIHEKMRQEFSSHGVEIHGIYSATDEDRKSEKRKPHPYLGLMAKAEFPTIDFSKSLIAGNSDSDMMFGKNLGMKTVFIDDKRRFSSAMDIEGADFETDSLMDMALSFKAGRILV